MKPFYLIRDANNYVTDVIRNAPEYEAIGFHAWKTLTLVVTLFPQNVTQLRQKLNNWRLGWIKPYKYLCSVSNSDQLFDD